MALRGRIAGYAFSASALVFATSCTCNSQFPLEEEIPIPTPEQTIEDGQNGINVNGNGEEPNPINHSPKALGQNVGVDEDTFIDIVLQGTDEDNDILTARITHNPFNGVIKDLEDNVVRYTPNSDFHGRDYFRFVVNDRLVDSTTGKVNINVKNINDAPVIEPIPAKYVQEGGYASVFLRSYISDPDGDTFSIEKTSGPGEIVYGTFSYHDQEDIDLENNQYVVGIKVTDDEGTQAHASFDLIQQDTEPAQLTVRSETLSSGLEAIVINDDVDYFPEQYHRRPQASIAVDSGGSPLIVYRNEEGYGNNLSYAKLLGETWVGGIIDSSGYATYSAIVFDQSDKPHISYTGNGSGAGEDLFYATIEESKWVTSEVDNSASVGLENDIALDSEGKVHISHWSWAEDTLKLSSNVSGEWVNETIQPASWSSTSIVLDNEDYVHIACHAQGGVNYVTNMSGNWESSAIGSYHHLNSILRMDSEQRLHVISHDTQSFYHSTRENGEWVSEKIIDNSPDFIKLGQTLSVAIDDNGRMAVPYILASEQLYLATNNGGDWQRFVVDDREGYRNPEITSDGSGNVHVSVLFDLGDLFSLKYITFDPDYFTE